jgi:SAM-dependent methyltransferase
MSEVSQGQSKGEDRRRVLNAGAGSLAARPLHPVFARDGWIETRIDINAAAQPDVVGSITDMSAAFAPQSFDAVWSSHVLEHLFVHEVPAALREFRRILKPDGFALITSPDLEAVASFIVERGADQVAYASPAGPITAIDLLFGHSASLARGHVHMAHKSGLTAGIVGQYLIDAGFPTVVTRRQRFDLWAVALMGDADEADILKALQDAGLDMEADAT